MIGIQAQRLVRVLCPHCKEIYAPDSEELRELGIAMDNPYQMGGRPKSPLYFEGWKRLKPIVPVHPDKLMLYRSVGCDECLGTGYHGRTGVYELVLITDEIRNHVLRNADSTAIKATARDEGMVSLRDDGVRKVLSGVTTIEEVLRVTHEDSA